MLEKLRDMPSGIDGVRAVGRLSKEDYDEVMEPLLAGARRAGRRLRFLYQLGPEFQGFTAAAAWEDAKLGLLYMRLFEACAVVTDFLLDKGRHQGRSVHDAVPRPGLRQRRTR